jgi:Domain of unknown function (DUF4340)
MTESAKTMTMAAIAAALLVLAIVIHPRQPYAEPEGEVGQLLFTDWKDPTAAKSMQIVTFDETRQVPNDFKVALVDGKWSIPSHGNYPAKAEDHVIKAASDLINLKILEVVSNAPGDHETYGVLEPDPAKLKNPAVGVGKLVTVKDAAGKDLARLIIGKEDKAPSGSEVSSLRFVRRAGQDRVYRVALSTDLFTTKFQDWIDPDLLGLKQHWDITKMQVRDYSLEEGRDGHVAVARKNEMAVEYNDQKSSWAVKQLTDYKDDKPVEAKLGADEEVDATKLNDAKTNLSGLKIVDIYRKPASFAGELKKNKDFLADPEARKSLAQLGFLASPSGKPTDLFAAGGDMTVAMKDGVEYVVRFGGVDLTFKEKDETKKSDNPAASKRTDAQRIVLVTARFNEDLLTKPTLEPLPEAKKPEAGKPADKKPDDKKSADAKPPVETKPESPKATAPKSPAAPAPGNKPPAGTKTEPKKSAAVARPDMTLALADPAADKKSEPAKPDAKPADVKKPAPEAKPEPGKTPASDIKRADEEKALDAERKRVETENKRKSDEYEAKVKSGKEHAKQLNDRFADWYYSITEDEYKKVHLTRADLIKKKTPAEGATGTGAGLPPVPTDPFKAK